MDQQLFAAIYDAHARAVYAHAVRMTFCPVGAEDIASLTFLEAWRLRETLDGVAGHRAWLLGVATNVMPQLVPCLTAGSGAHTWHTRR
ncbi:RNA polymerase sigma factor [Streptomyces sp. NPDC054949]